ncbi:MAG: outer membrane lipoprotein-sorting protein [Treponema sp.]|nr:outer membrane lipoprotein-sorting protein [Treponema sp.]
MKTFLRPIFFCCIFFAINLMLVVAQNNKPDPMQLLTKVDSNEVFNSIQYTGKMVIEYQGKKFVKIFKAQSKGSNYSFVEFLNNEDKGTKYLKREGRLYVYSPDTESVMLISGHMLKESMMGSDMSYEDTIENEKLSVRYTPVLLGKEVLEDREAWILELSAKKKTESYPKQKMWIDVQTSDVLKTELYALSGAKLKEYKLLQVKVINGRRFPVEFEMKDLLRKGSRTILTMTDVVLDEPIADSVFSMGNLER